MPLVAQPELRHVFDARIQVTGPCEVGTTSAGERRVIGITGGHVEGTDVSGIILPGGADCQVIAQGGLTHLHARYAIETDRGERNYVENTGIRFAPPPQRPGRDQYGYAGRPRPDLLLENPPF